jgi:D-serine deaminase-like pyridoxal phosphate-dependent protein
MDIMTLSTPALVIDEARVRANITRWQSLANQYGVALRPHIKTHKTLEIARMQIAAGAKGITSAAKLSEAEVFIDAGFTDCFVAYPIIGADKCAHAAQLALRCHLIVGVDSLVGIRAIVRCHANGRCHHWGTGRN